MRKLSAVLAVTMTFALVGCGKKSAKNSDTPAGNSGGGGGIVAAGGVGVVTDPGAALGGGRASGGGGGGGGGGGAVQAVRKAVRRAAAMNELKNLAETIEAMRDPTGRMPSKDAILAEAKKSLPTSFEGLESGAYLLANPMEPGGLWVYEVDADTKSSIAVIGGRAARQTPDDLQQYAAVMKQPAPKAAAQEPAPKTTTQQPPPAQTGSVSEKDMKDIHTLIENFSQANSGKMPDAQFVYTTLMQSKSPAAELIQKQAIYLMQPKVRESVWAVEAKALTQGGMIVTQNGVETVTAAEAKKRTGQ